MFLRARKNGEGGSGRKEARRRARKKEEEKEERQIRKRVRMPKHHRLWVFLVVYALLLPVISGNLFQGQNYSRKEQLYRTIFRTISNRPQLLRMWQHVRRHKLHGHQRLPAVPGNKYHTVLYSVCTANSRILVKTPFNLSSFSSPRPPLRPWAAATPSCAPALKETTAASPWGSTWQ